MTIEFELSLTILLTIASGIYLVLSLITASLLSKYDAINLRLPLDNCERFMYILCGIFWPAILVIYILINLYYLFGGK